MAGPDSPTREKPDGTALRKMLSSMISVAERLAVLAQAKRTGELTALANRLDSSSEPLDGDVRDEVWANSTKEDRMLTRICKCMDQGDIQSAAQVMTKLATHGLHRHAKSREQFFTVGRGAGGAESFNEAEQSCLDVESCLDAVIPEVKQYFADLAHADADQQAIEYIEQCRQQAHEQRMARIEHKARKAQMVRSQRRRHKAQQAQMQAELAQKQLEEEEQAREEFRRIQEARAEKYRDAARRAKEDRRKKATERHDAALAMEREGARSAPPSTKAMHAELKAEIKAQELESLRDRERGWGRSSAQRMGSPSLLPPFKPRNAKATAKGTNKTYISAAKALEHSPRMKGGRGSPTEEPTEPPLSPVRLMSNTRTPEPAKDDSDLARRKAEMAKALAAEKRRMAKFASCPLPKPKGLPTDPISGEVLSSETFIATSPMFNEEPCDERAPLRTLLSIITAGNRTMSTAGDGTANEIDTKVLAEITGMVESHVNTLLAEYVTEVKRANRPMKVEHFRRFMRKHNFSDAMIINRLFEVFDVSKAGVITFAELLVGLCFFINHKKWHKSRENPLFLDYSARFLDIDGLEKVSKFKLSIVCGSTFDKEFATELSDALWEILSVDGGPISYAEFQRLLCEMDDMREVVHQIMVLQSLENTSTEFAEIQEEITEITREWREWKAVGRLFALDRIVEEFVATPDKSRQEALALQADEIANGRKGRDGIAGSFYVKTLRHLIIEKDGPRYIRDEIKSLQETLDNDHEEENGHPLEGDTRLRLEMGMAILEAVHAHYQ